MESLIRLLAALIQKVPWLSESEKQAAEQWLRDTEANFGVVGVTAPVAVDQPAPAPPPPAVDPGPVAEPVPPDQQAPPPASPDLGVGDPENTNAFSGTDADDVPGSP